MPLNTKRLLGKLKNMKDTEQIAEGIIYLSLDLPMNPNRQPQCKGMMTVKGFMPQLYDKHYILHLDKFSGKVFLVSPPEIARGNLINRDLTQTPLKIMFADSIWRSPDWADFLRTLFWSN
jgi:hypothetical protein